jgi:hypothetical protein
MEKLKICILATHVFETFLHHKHERHSGTLISTNNLNHLTAELNTLIKIPAAESGCFLFTMYEYSFVLLSLQSKKTHQRNLL